MRVTAKPVRKCHGCLLNLDDHCWLYPVPREQWRNGKTCHARDDEAIHRDFAAWQKRPSVLSRREIRREAFRAHGEPRVPPRERAGRGPRH